MLGRNVVASGYQAVPVDIAHITAIDGFSQHILPNNGVGTVCSNHQVARCSVPILKDGSGAGGILFHSNALGIELDTIGSEGIQQQVLQVGTGNRIGALPDPFHQWCQTECRQFFSQMAVVRHAVHLSAYAGNLIP